MPNVHGASPQGPAPKFISVDRAADKQKVSEPILRRRPPSKMQSLLRFRPNTETMNIVLNAIFSIAAHVASASAAAKSAISDPAVQHGTKDPELTPRRDLVLQLLEVRGCTLRPAARQGVNLPVSELAVEDVLHRGLPPLRRWAELGLHRALEVLLTRSVTFRAQGRSSSVATFCSTPLIEMPPSRSVAWLARSLELNAPSCHANHVPSCAAQNMSLWA